MTHPLPTFARLRLQPRSRLGAGWNWIVAASREYMPAYYDPWRLHPIDLAARIVPDIPGLLALYATIGLGHWQYTGITTRSVRTRMLAHASDRNPHSRAVKADRWSHLVAIPLIDDTPAGELQRLERLAQRQLCPRMGERWSRPPTNHHREVQP